MGKDKTKVYLYTHVSTSMQIENALVEAKAKKRSILAEKVCGDNIYKALIFLTKCTNL